MEAPRHGWQTLLLKKGLYGDSSKNTICKLPKPEFKGICQRSFTVEMKQNAAIFILTQNTEIRRTYLKTTLYFLFRYFNAKHQYPVVLLHEGDYNDPRAQREILMSVRSSCRSLITFVALDEDDFQLPPHISKDKMDKCIATQAVPYWRNDKYRMMCRWWLVHFPKYAKGYDYVMRIDDDLLIEEPIDIDMFQWMVDNELVYSSNMIHVDCGICCYGMKEFFQEKFPDKKDVIDKVFIKQELPMRSVQLHPFRTLLSITHHPTPPKIEEKMAIYMPTMYYNNFFITKTSFWEREDVKKTIEEIDDNGGIFYYRWGDAPLQSTILLLHAKTEEIKRSIFRYSKRLQREAFQADDGEFHSYMPSSYDKTSCITES
jgi:hypothetical protein